MQAKQARLSPTRQLALIIFTVVAMLLAVLWERFTDHPILWLLLLIASIPVFAALLGGFPQRRQNKRL